MTRCCSNPYFYGKIRTPVFYINSRTKYGKNVLVGMSDYTIIADVANSKRHQWLNKILILTRTILEISKVVCKKTLLGMCAFCEQAYAVWNASIIASVCWPTGLPQVSRAYCMTEVFLTTLQIRRSSAGKKKKIKILSSRWWHFELATSHIASNHFSSLKGLVTPWPTSGMLLGLLLSLCYECSNETLHYLGWQWYYLATLPLLSLWAYIIPNITYLVHVTEHATEPATKLVPSVSQWDAALLGVAIESPCHLETHVTSSLYHSFYHLPYACCWVCNWAFDWACCCACAFSVPVRFCITLGGNGTILSLLPLLSLQAYIIPISPTLCMLLGMRLGIRLGLLLCLHHQCPCEALHYLRWQWILSCHFCHSCHFKHISFLTSLTLCMLLGMWLGLQVSLCQELGSNTIILPLSHSCHFQASIVPYITYLVHVAEHVIEHLIEPAAVLVPSVSRWDSALLGVAVAQPGHFHHLAFEHAESGYVVLKLNQNV